MPTTTPNPDTHCTSCGEVLSEYHHCWQCHYPPMDPAQDATPQPTTQQPETFAAEARQWEEGGQYGG